MGQKDERRHFCGDLRACSTIGGYAHQRGNSSDTGHYDIVCGIQAAKGRANVLHACVIKQKSGAGLCKLHKTMDLYSPT